MISKEMRTEMVFPTGWRVTRMKTVSLTGQR